MEFPHPMSSVGSAREGREEGVCFGDIRRVSFPFSTPSGFLVLSPI